MSSLLQTVCTSLADSGGHWWTLVGMTGDMGMMGGMMGG
jgi:hypothetical protein